MGGCGSDSPRIQNRCLSLRICLPWSPSHPNLSHSSISRLINSEAISYHWGFFTVLCRHGAEGKDQIFHDQITKRNSGYTVFKFSLNWILIFSLIWLHCYDFTWCFVFTNKNTLHSLMEPWNVKLVDEQACFYFILNMQEWFAVLQL